MIRHFINLLEHNFNNAHVWHGTSKKHAKDLLENGIDMSKSEGGYFGYGFYVADNPELAQSNYADFSGEEKDDGVVLEYIVSKDARILDLRDESDWLIWRDGKYADHLHDRNLWKRLVHKGIDGVYDRSFEGICVYNKDALVFHRVYSGVVGDPLEDIDTNELDEFASGGLQRCTAVTVNALLKDFNLRPITLNDVPVDHPGVIRILDQRGLAYKPVMDAAGRTVRQFAMMHRMGDWYILTPSHAMALIKGELYDAENKGLDGRKIEAAFQITRR